LKPLAPSKCIWTIRNREFAVILATARDYRPTDFDRLCEIDRLCFPPGIAYSPEDISIVLLEPGAFVVVGEAQGAIAGFILARRERAGRAHIITIDVLAEHRRTGLGGLLLQEAHRRLRALGATRVILEVAVENAPAIAFYEKHGYDRLRRLKNYYLDRDDAWQMSKNLV
jgi:ribosomal-protein-alanine N-acetyltransferase